ncbi:squalene/phytoene synthase family protein [Rhodobacterales bacterium HKCCE2091]|nr:squalene/phytoene synthase family protein [Rhodobacterales bacterium HKCCE2091]
MSLQACADLVARADPDRFRVAMAAPVEARRVLFPLYAFNVEVARAPWVTSEPMIAEMRLQFWRDVLEEIAAGQAPRAHEVAEDLGFLDPEAARVLDALIAARRWDIGREPFEDRAAFDAYLDATAGGLMWVSARALGAGSEGEAAARDAGWAAGLVAWFRAIPALEQAGRVPLVDGRPDAVSRLAGEGLTRLMAARARRGEIARASWPALRPCVTATALLDLAAREPGRVQAGELWLNPLHERALTLRSLATGRWW